MTLLELSAPLRGSAPRGLPEDFLARCEAHGILGLMHARSSASPAGFPEEVRSELARKSLGVAARELADIVELSGALETLARADVPALIFKGVALAYSIYEAPHLRPRIDTDILVHARHAARARRALEEIGYAKDEWLAGDATTSQIPLVKRDRRGGYHSIDLHWAVSCRKAVAKRLTPELLFRGAVPLPALGPHALVPRPAVSLAIACLHPTLHHPDELKLIWLNDAHLLASAFSKEDWADFASLALATQTSSLLAGSLAAAKAHFGTSLPTGLLETLLATKCPAEVERLAGDRRDRLSDVWLDFQSLPWRERAAFARAVVLPPRSYMRESYAPGSRLPLTALYALRAGRGLVKWLRGRG